MARALRISVDEVDDRADLRLGREVALPHPGPAGDDEQLGVASRGAAACAHSASVTNGMTGWSRRRYVSRTSTRAHQVASRASGGERSRRRAGPWRARGPSRSTRSRWRRRRAASPRRTRSRPSPRRPPRWSPRPATAASARPGRGGGRRAGVARRRRGSSPGGRRRRSGSRSRACWRSSGRARAWPPRSAGRCPGVAPWMTREAEGVGAGLVDDAERVDDVALRLRHLLAERVADEPGQVDRVERLAVRSARARASSSGRPRRR